ncbi:MAG: glycosyltransferase [bacterium]
MQVVHIYKDSYPPITGGVEISMHRLVDGCRDVCGGLSVLVAGRRWLTERSEIEGIPVVRVGEWGRFLSNPIAPTFPLWLARTSADILHYHLPHPTAVISHLLARPRGKVVVHYHSDIVRQAKIMPFYRPLLYRFLRSSDRIIATSPNYLETSPVLRHFREKCRVVPLGVPLNRFVPTQEVEDSAQVIRRRYGMRLILFVGILRYYKGVQYLLDAMRHVDGTLLVIGDGPRLGSLMKQASELPYGNRIHFLGQVEDVVPYYFASDIFCLPSVFRSEAFGIVLIEAAAAGLPLVSTEIGTGTSYINLHEKTGLVVPPADPASLGQALSKLLDDTELRLQYGVAAQHRARSEFSQERMVQGVLSVYEEVLGRPLTYPVEEPTVEVLAGVD